MSDLSIIGRSQALFQEDLETFDAEFRSRLAGSRVLVVGAGGTIGQAVCKEIFERSALSLHAVDINENSLVELVRDIRSSQGYVTSDFKTFALDVGSREFELMFNSEGPYDYVFNLSAMKHVRSERDVFTLLRLVRVNILNTVKLAELCEKSNVKKYFCVSTDKAANPVNMMGCSKKIMELFLRDKTRSLNVSMARFANVAFSDGSLLHGFNQRYLKKQPISAPIDVRRYFVTKKESGLLCLFSALEGDNRDIYFPKLTSQLHLTKFSDIAERFIRHHGFEPYHCASEEHARESSAELIANGRWPCYFFNSDTTGEKPHEEFFVGSEKLNFHKFKEIGIIESMEFDDPKMLNLFLSEVENALLDKSFKKENLVQLFRSIVPEFDHSETGKDLDQKM